MAHPLTSGAEAIASVLGELPGLREVHPFPKPLSQCQDGEAVMALAGVSPPGASGVNTQTVVWDLVVMLRGTAAGNAEEQQQTIADLCSLDPDRGILGVLYNNDTQVAALRQLGIDPYLDQDAEGITIDYNVEIGEKTANLLRCQIQAELEAQ